MTDWFARPVLHVKDVDASLRFYVELVGFTSPWRYDEEGRARVAQVQRQGCALILANNLSAEKAGQGTIFISLNVEPTTIEPANPANIESTDLESANVESAALEAAAVALDALRAEFEGRGVPVREGSWGYRLLVVDDPDGNQLLFNYPNGNYPNGN